MTSANSGPAPSRQSEEKCSQLDSISLAPLISSTPDIPHSSPAISPLHDLLCACACALELDAVTTAAAQHLLRTCDAASPPPRLDIAVLAASLLVAVKAQNGDRKLRDIINVVHAALLPDSPPLTIGPEFWGMRDAVVLMEQRLLRACAFQVEFDATQLQLVSISTALNLTPSCCRLALAILTDSNRCPTLAHAGQPMRLAAALECARMISGLQLPPVQSCWFVSLGIDDADLRSVCSRVLQFFTAV